MKNSYFIIGGTEKAGTTSVYTYLSQRSETIASKRKETDFFRRAGGTIEDYHDEFHSGEQRIYVEASPGYLGEAKSVAPRIAEMIPDAQLLFILREPVERLYSSFNFHRAKLDLPADLEFAEYFDLCVEYYQGNCQSPKGDNQIKIGNRTLGSWYLRTMGFGCYADHLKHYMDVFPREQLKITFYDDLRRDGNKYLEDICKFIGLPSSEGEESLPFVNKTFSSRNKGAHRLAHWMNRKFEPVFRSNPALKGELLRLYKSMNQAKDGYDPMPQADRLRAEEFYASSNNQLASLLGSPLPERWIATSAR